MINDICVIITAAGLSLRNPGKLLMDIEGVSVISRVVSLFVNLPLDVILVTGNDQNQVIDHIDSNYIKKIQIVHNTHYHTGLSSSIKYGVAESKSEYKYFGFCNGDKPFIQVATVTKLVNILDSKRPDILVPVYEKTPGHPVFFQRKYKNDLINLKGDTGARQLIKKYQDSVNFKKVNDEGIITDMDSYLNKKY
ncbi:MAG: nucleotidyltransferase family protein [Candidatus Marinimicrobia bacterium]|jgi:molybdenum cofactor cytidylyltransferase|nr:nucleotidyltransferase family protein [Candidatus Neomarinimicrobiota bacterium]MBT3633757.1 nucleotidyltransferase family protein [Candidatus Neomarinimicrobiota bacterium]MBT3682549.1 nucleotidyltransferase family protein [Candidatus Neomarinimicrobiota bacterium]MBT3759313.1 nucleotidyltransferase family protein [Candidatus Neomarinimicrobiota bacterium]MBT3894679.1 nucleotidyltransferase family protein [Candidatus Neomarinimicrobiota bacterium]